MAGITRENFLNYWLLTWQHLWKSKQMPAYIWICNIQLQQHKHMQTKNAALQSNKFCLFVVLRKCLEFQSQIQHLSSMLNSFSRSTKNNKKVSQISEKSLKSNSGAYTHTHTHKHEFEVTHKIFILFSHAHLTQILG